MPRPRVRDVQTRHGAVREYKRFGIWHRIEHWIFMASFSLLGLTGLLQRYAESPVSQAITELMGGIESIRIIHRISAVVMMLMVIYHIGAVSHRMYVERKRLTMLPGMVDIRNAIQALLYNLGFRKHHAQQGRYGFEEKAEYWAVVWGTVIMGITGFMMWNPISTAKFLPGGFIPAAKTAHSLEAVLAVAAIFLWHFYNVLVKTFNRSMFNGYLTEEQMAEEHPIELADIKAGTARRPPDPEAERKRKRVFWPIFSVVIIAMLLIIYWWVTFEETAIATVPPASQVEVFVPLTPTPLPTPQPTPTLADIASATWDNGISDMFTAKCVSCHNSTGKLGGLDLTSYQAALDGGDTGPGIAPGDPENSQVVVIQSAGGHPGQFSFNELDIIIQWIEAGAPEN